MQKKCIAIKGPAHKSDTCFKPCLNTCRLSCFFPMTKKQPQQLN